MMQFLKSILSRSNSDAELSARVDNLQRELDETNERVAELSNAIKTLAHSYVTLSQEVMCVSDIIRQAANMAKQNDCDLLLYENDNDDGGGYLN